MRIVFLSNYYNVHQLHICTYLYEKLGEKFTFVATTPITTARLKQGYSDMNSQYPYVLRAYEDDAQRKKAQQLTDEADVVIIGSAPLDFVQSRLKKKKLTFLYSERLYRSQYQWWKLPLRMLRFWKKYGRHKSMYLLCASAFSAADYAKTYTFLGKAYQWGYFPKTHRYENVDALLEQKHPASILWTARFLKLKHPEHVLEVACRLKAEGYDFQIKMLGSGEQWDAIARSVRENGLENQIQLIGAVPAEKVRSYMDEASIFLFTSDKNEGWGAVLNESMNSACAVVASDAIGAVPFLVQDGENGLCYKSCDVDDLYKKVKFLLDHEEERKVMGRKAYETVTDLWNAETAAQRLLELSKQILQGDKRPDLYETGPCSKAPILKG